MLQTKNTEIKQQVKSDKRFSLMGPMRRKYASVESLWRSAVHLALEQRSMDLGERFKWVKSEQQLPGAFQKKAEKNTRNRSWVFWVEQKFREVWV